MSPAQAILQMVPLMGSSPPQLYSFPPLFFLMNSPPSSLMSPLIPPMALMVMSPTMSPATTVLMHYMTGQPTRSTERSCGISETAGMNRLQLWRPLQGRVPYDHSGAHIPLSEGDLNRILTVIGHLLASGTKETYGLGLLVFHVFCDVQGIPEEQRGPASSLLILAFIASCAGMYSGKTLDNYYYGVRAWHLLHSLVWLADPAQVASALEGGARFAPAKSTRPKCCPFTVATLRAICSTMDLSAPLDAAVYGCLVTSFFCLTRLGEFTSHSLTSFNSALHVKPSDICFDEDCHGLKVTVLHLPQTKMSTMGEDVYFAPQSGDVDPHHALSNHLFVNTPSPSAALFSWHHQKGLCPLTHSAFLNCLDRAATQLGMESLTRHRLHIGGTLEYLLRRVPFETVKSIGRWKGDAFVGYLHQHAIIMAPYLQESPVLEPFTCYALPAVR
ncbi:uncharacterized protein EDB93DRAFT_1256828 [Suillus bovinus]|uniref:uncharacterized protein n=1 Tax=Suillus bovinus TaxID=48563 RepID=UPI001B86CE60|nr:uncharacterized protein EDB93DRAFT_1256828 [Suillus bovinus]KAG2127906.1 hypothetical protein EDB93DRAFT_1256828 [Suillus bovinus]